jgi:hypothetical protein
VAVSRIAADRFLQDLDVGQVAEIFSLEGGQPFALVRLPAVEAVDQDAAPGDDDRRQPVDRSAVPLDCFVVLADAGCRPTPAGGVAWGGAACAAPLRRSPLMRGAWGLAAAPRTF